MPSRPDRRRRPLRAALRARGRAPLPARRSAARPNAAARGQPGAPPRGVQRARRVVFGALAFRVTQLQVLSGNRYRRCRSTRPSNTVPLPGAHGTIFDRNGSDLAMSIELTSVYADPKQVTDPILLRRRARADPARRAQRPCRSSPTSTSTSSTSPVASSDHVVAAVKKLELPGVGFVPESARQYPAGALAGSLIGDVGGRRLGP